MDAGREQLLARFAAYLEEAPDQAPEADAPDLFTLLAELAAVKNEVRLESRQVKAALDRFGELFDTLRQGSQRLQDELDRQRERAATERREAEQSLLLELLELHDRLSAGRGQAAGYQPGWLARRGGADRFVAGMADGMGMNLRRLEGLLERRGVRPLETLGQPFDPHRMHAVDTADRPGTEPGLVVDEVRRGFVRDGRVLRPAEVVVNKRQETA